MSKQTVGILIFNEVEVLDFAGPFEVFATTKPPSDDRDSDERAFHVVTIAERSDFVKCRGGLSQWLATGAMAPPPSILTWQAYLSICGWLTTASETSSPRSLAPLDPPPRLLLSA